MSELDMPESLSHVEFFGDSRATYPLARIIRHDAGNFNS